MEPCRNHDVLLGAILGCIALAAPWSLSGCGSETADVLEDGFADAGTRGQGADQEDAGWSDAGSDIDTDTNVDIDVDTDIDTDADTDTDSDVDADAGTDGARCLEPGETFETSTTGGSTSGVCCPGLTPILQTTWDAQTGCLYPSGDVHVCTEHCGDGVCDGMAGENLCNCAVDCDPDLGGNPCEDAGGICIASTPWAVCPAGTWPSDGTPLSCNGDSVQCCEAAPPSDCSGADDATCLPGGCTGCWFEDPLGRSCGVPDRSCCVNMCNAVDE